MTAIELKCLDMKLLRLVKTEIQSLSFVRFLSNRDSTNWTTEILSRYFYKNEDDNNTKPKNIVR